MYGLGGGLSRSAWACEVEYGLGGGLSRSVGRLDPGGWGEALVGRYGPVRVSMDWGEVLVGQ